MDEGAGEEAWKGLHVKIGVLTRIWPNIHVRSQVRFTADPQVGQRFECVDDGGWVSTPVLHSIEPKKGYVLLRARNVTYKLEEAK